MAKVKFGSQSIDNNFDLPNIDLQSVVGDYNDFDIGQEKGSGDLFLILKQNNKNYVELHGRFDFLHGFKLSSMIKEINEIKIVGDGKTTYEVTGLEMLKTDIADDNAFSQYLQQQAYSIVGNAAKNKLIAGDFADTLNGLGGNDFLSGMGGRDKLNGGNGSDKLLGGDGNDRLTGGSDADMFIFKDGFGSDTITDFQARGRGQDHIDLSDYTGVSRFADLHIHRVSGGVEIELTNNDSIILQHVNIHDLGRADFLF